MSKRVSTRGDRKTQRRAKMHGEAPVDELPPALSELRDKRPRSPARGPLTSPRPAAPPPPGAVDSVSLRDGYLIHRLDRAREVECSKCGKRDERTSVIAARLSGRVVGSVCFGSLGR